MNNIIKISADDWEVIYVDGEIFAEGHKIGNKEWFVLGQTYNCIEFDKIKEYYFDNDAMEKIAYNFSKYIEDIPKELFKRG